MNTASVLYDLMDAMVRPYNWVPQKTLRAKKMVPMMNVSEDDGNVYAKLVVPGIQREDINVSIQNNVLAVSGKKVKPKIDGKLYRGHCWYGEFSREIAIDKDVDVDNVEAQYENGILTIIMPKRQKKSIKQIAVKQN